MKVPNRDDIEFIKELRIQHGIFKRQGARTDLHLETKTWSEYLKTLGLCRTTAWRWLNNQWYKEGPRIVYAVQSGPGNDGPVKVGSTTDITKKMKLISRMCPYPVYFRNSIVGGYRKEHEYHKMFKGWHLHDEWYSCNVLNPIFWQEESQERKGA